MHVLDLLPVRAMRSVAASALRAAVRERENRSKETDRVVVAQRWARRWKEDAIAWRADAIEAGRLTDQLRCRLTEVADALMGPPKPQHQHGWADLPAIAAQLKRELAIWKARARRRRRDPIRIFQAERPLYDRIMELERQCATLRTTLAEKEQIRRANEDEATQIIADMELDGNRKRLRAERAEALLLKVVEHHAGESFLRDERGFDDRGNAPNHGHMLTGVWDWDNGPEKAGKACEWCATWREIVALVKPEKP